MKFKFLFDRNLKCICTLIVSQSESVCFIPGSLNIILGIRHHPSVTVHPDESLVLFWIIHCKDLTGIVAAIAAATAAATEFVQVEEEDGEEDSEAEEGENNDKRVYSFIVAKQTQSITIPLTWSRPHIPPAPPDNISDCCDSNIDISKLLTESDFVVFTTTVNVQSGESKESDSGEDNEGGLSVEDLQRGFREEVDCGEEREEEWRNEQQNDGEGETREPSTTMLIYNIYIN